MKSLSTDLVDRFAFNSKLLAMLSDGLDEAAWRATPGDAGNSAHWILGHVVSSRRNLLRMAGVELDAAPWEAGFAMGATPPPADALPPVAELVADLERSQRELARVVGALDDEAAARPLPRPFPDGADTLLGGLSFLNFHEVYHLGQLGLLRRQTGHAGFA